MASQQRPTDRAHGTIECLRFTLSRRLLCRRSRCSRRHGTSPSGGRRCGPTFLEHFGVHDLGDTSPR